MADWRTDTASATAVIIILLFRLLWWHCPHQRIHQFALKCVPGDSVICRFSPLDWRKGNKEWSLKLTRRKDASLLYAAWYTLILKHSWNWQDFSVENSPTRKVETSHWLMFVDPKRGKKPWFLKVWVKESNVPVDWKIRNIVQLYIKEGNCQSTLSGTLENRLQEENNPTKEKTFWRTYGHMNRAFWRIEKKCKFKIIIIFHSIIWNDITESSLRNTFNCEMFLGTN